MCNQIVVERKSFCGTVLMVFLLKQSLLFFRKNYWRIVNSLIVSCILIFLRVRANAHARIFKLYSVSSQIYTHFTHFMRLHYYILVGILHSEIRHSVSAFDCIECSPITALMWHLSPNFNRVLKINFFFLLFF